MRKACKRLSLDAKNLSLFSSTVLIFSGIFILTCFIIAKLLQLSGSILRSNYWNTSPVNPNHIFELRETSQNLLWISQTTTQSIHPKEGMDMVSVLTKMFPAPQGGSFLLDVFCGQVDNIRVQVASFIHKILESTFVIIMAHYYYSPQLFYKMNYCTK